MSPAGVFGAAGAAVWADTAKAAVASGIAAVFVEAHPDPDQALCDGPSALPSQQIPAFVEQLAAIDRLVKAQPALEIA